RWASIFSSPLTPFLWHWAAPFLRSPSTLTSINLKAILRTTLLCAPQFLPHSAPLPLRQTQNYHAAAMPQFWVDRSSPGTTDDWFRWSAGANRRTFFQSSFTIHSRVLCPDPSPSLPADQPHQKWLPAPYRRQHPTSACAPFANHSTLPSTYPAMPGQCHVLHPFRRYVCGVTVQTIASSVILLTRTELMERRLSVRQLPASRPAKYGLVLGSLHSGMTGDRHDAIQRTRPAAHSPRTPTGKLPTYSSHLHATQHSVRAQQALVLASLTNQGTVSNRSTMIRRGQVLLLGGFKHTLQRARAKQNTRPYRLLPLTKRVLFSGRGLITVDNDELEAAAHPPLPSGANIAANHFPPARDVKVVRLRF
ncbi:hypothetical protein JMJ77_0014541, partial [Colletotrichum scovillei]